MAGLLLRRRPCRANGPLENTISCQVQDTDNGPRYALNGIIYYAVVLDLRNGRLTPKYEPSWKK